ncbi:MAG: hypothetical protein ABIY52_11210 [Gemmatimonadaceae bacterium]
MQSTRFRSVLSAAMLFVLAMGAACQVPGIGGPSLSGSGTKILFIGNSYTYVNDVPGIVQAFGDAAGVPFAVATVAMPDFALVDHLNQGSAQREIEKGGWAYVVLQQGPSSVEVNRDTLRLATKVFADAMRPSGAKPALFSAWPTAGRRVDYPRAIESYRLAAADVDGLFLPVAGAWLEAWKVDPALALYAGDGLHASAEGSYLSALTIFAVLAKRSPIGLPNKVRTLGGTTIEVTPAMAKLLQEAAAAATQ